MDGVPDLAIGAPNSTNGQAVVIFMKADGTYHTTPAPLVIEAPSSPAYVAFGSSLAAIGDIDYNGVPDLFVG